MRQVEDYFEKIINKPLYNIICCVYTTYP